MLFPHLFWGQGPALSAPRFGSKVNTAIARIRSASRLGVRRLFHLAAPRHSRRSDFALTPRKTNLSTTIRCLNNAADKARQNGSYCAQRKPLKKGLGCPS